MGTIMNSPTMSMNAATIRTVSFAAEFDFATGGGEVDDSLMRYS
jgi:hypothetical protein